MGLSKNWLVLSEPPILLQDSSQAPENVNKKFKNNVTAQYSKLCMIKLGYILEELIQEYYH